MRRWMICAVLAMLLMRAITACAAPEEPPNVAGSHTPGETPLGVETPSAEGTPVETTEPPDTLPAPGKKVFGTGSAVVTSKDGYKAKISVTFYEPREVDPEWARMGDSTCGATSGDPVLTRSGVKVWAMRVEGTMVDLKPDGFAWDFAAGTVEPKVPYSVGGPRPSGLGDDPVEYGMTYLAATGCEGGNKGGSVLVPMSADQPGTFRGEFLTYVAPSPKHPKVNTAHMRVVLLGMANAGLTLSRSMSYDNQALDADCDAAKVSKGMIAYQGGALGNGACVIAPDIR